MADILAESLSGKIVMDSDGTEFGVLYNITADMKSGELRNLFIQPNGQIFPRRVSFSQDDHGRFRVPVSRVQAVRDYIVV